MKDEGQNPDDALSWVRSEMADEAGIDFDEFMTDFDWGDFPGKAEGGRIGMMYGGDPGFAFEYGGSWADWRDKHQHQMPVTDYIKTRLPKERLPFRDMQSGGLAYMLGEPTYMKYEGGGSVGHAPWHKPSGQPQPQGQEQSPTPQVGGAQSPGRGQPNPMKAPRGGALFLPSLAPRTMDPAHMQQQAMQKAMMGQGQPRMGMGEGGFTQDDFNRFLKERKEMHREGGKYGLQEDWEKYKRFKQYGQGAIQEAAQGGRIGFGLGGIDKGRRAFMKWLAGITGAGIAAGSGLLKFGKAAKVVPKVAETVVTFEKTGGMPAWFPALVNRIIKEGGRCYQEAGNSRTGNGSY